MNSNNEIQGYKMYPMLHFRRKFSSGVTTLRKRAEWYCGPTVPQDAELCELEWRGQGAVVTYLKCPRCGKEGCYVEDDRGQGVVPYWKKEKMSWCGCKGGKEQSGV